MGRRDCALSTEPCPSGLGEEERHFVVHHPKGKFKPKQRQNEIKEREGEEAWREGSLGQFPPTQKIKGLHAGLDQQQATPRALRRLVCLLLYRY